LQAITEANTTEIDPKTVRENFNKAVKDARDALKAARKNAEANPAIVALKKTRDDAIKAAETAFKTATEKARADLQTALKQ
jgi:predicted transcriptional regulator